MRIFEKIVLPDELLSRVTLDDMTHAGLATVVFDVSNEKHGRTEAGMSDF